MHLDGKMGVQIPLLSLTLLLFALHDIEAVKIATGDSPDIFGDFAGSDEITDIPGFDGTLPAKQYSGCCHLTPRREDLLV